MLIIRIKINHNGAAVFKPVRITLICFQSMKTVMVGLSLQHFGQIGGKAFCSSLSMPLSFFTSDTERPLFICLPCLSCKQHFCVITSLIMASRCPSNPTPGSGMGLEHVAGARFGHLL